MITFKCIIFRNNTKTSEEMKIILIITVIDNKVAWASGLRRWFKAPVSSEAWVQIPPLPDYFFFSVSNYYFSFKIMPIILPNKFLIKF